MSIEILSVGLEEETIEKLASRIADKLVGFPTRAVTESNPPAANPRRTRSANDSVPPPDEPPDDPWLENEGHPTDAAPASTSRGRASSAGQASTSTTRQGNGGSKERDKYGRTWSVGLLDAPECYCGEPAAKVHAKSQKGNWYDVWKCAKGAPGGNYRDKCDYSEFPQREGEQA